MKEFLIVFEFADDDLENKITIEARTKEEAIKRFYNRFSDTTFIVKCEDITNKSLNCYD